MSTLLLFFKKTTVLQHSKECIILYFFTFVSCDWFQSIHIRIHIRLLDPCFKTGRLSVKWIGTTLSHLNRIKIIVYHFDICSIMLNYYICFSFLHLVFGEIQHIQFMNWFQNASIYRTITWSPKTFNQEFLVAIKKILESCIEKSWSSPNFTNNPFQLCHFRSFLTLFPKCFSSFPRGTSLLSVFPLYLGFGVYYHHFNLHFQVNLLLFLIITQTLFAPTGLSPFSVEFCSWILGRQTISFELSIHLGYNSRRLAKPLDTKVPSISAVTSSRFYQLGLCLFHSPLL